MAVSLSISIAQNSQSIENNTTNVTVKVKCSWTYGSWNHNKKSGYLIIDGTKYTFTNNFNTSETTTGSKTLFTKTVNVEHDDLGKKELSCSAQYVTGVSSGTITASASKTLTDIPRAATIDSAPDFTDEDNPTITYTNLAGNAVETLEACISLDGSSADIAYRDISKSGTSYTFNLTEAERNVLRKATQGSNTRTVKFYVATTIGGTTYRKSTTVNFTVIDAMPTLTPSAVDTGSVSTVLTGDANNIVIKGYNAMQVAISATAQKGATISNYAISCGGKSINTASGELSRVESGTFNFSVTDSRGNTISKTLTKTLIDYIKLTCNLKVSAPTADGDMNISVSGNIFNGSFGAVENTLTVDYRIKVNDEEYSPWTAIPETSTATLNITTYNVGFTLTGIDYKQSFTVQARARDKIYNGETEDAVLSAQKKVKTTPIFDWGENDFNFNVPVNVQGDITAQENIVIRNGGVGIRGTTTDGTEIQALQPCNTNNNLSLGYGGYENAIGASNIYGNEVKLISNGSIYANGMTLAENKVLWSGGIYMTENHTATLSEEVSKQANGIVLLFSAYEDGTYQNQNFFSYFIPKKSVELFNGNGYGFFMSTSTLNVFASKYLYIHNDKIVGHANNNATGTSNSGIKFTNNRFVLRYVIGV